MLAPPTCNVDVALIVGAAMVPDAVIFTAVAVPVKAGLALGAYFESLCVWVYNVVSIYVWL